MKIVNMKSDNLCDFEDISIGECFIYNHNIYIKALPAYCDISNAVLLITGELRSFNKDEKVIPITAKVMIE